MRATAALLCVVAIVACVGGPASAQTDAKTPPCLGDIKRLCALVPPAGNFVQECLEARRSELSPDCSKHVDDLTRDTMALVASCRWDLVRFCSGAQNVAGERVACLNNHRDALSPKCRERLNDESSK